MIVPGVFLLAGETEEDLHRAVFPEPFPETRYRRDENTAFPELVMATAVQMLRIEAALLEGDIAEAIRLQDFDKIERLHVVEHYVLARDHVPPAVASRWSVG